MHSLPSVVGTCATQNTLLLQVGARRGTGWGRSRCGGARRAGAPDPVRAAAGACLRRQGQLTVAGPGILSGLAPGASSPSFSCALLSQILPVLRDLASLLLPEEPFLLFTQSTGCWLSIGRHLVWSCRPVSLRVQNESALEQS